MNLYELTDEYLRLQDRLETEAEDNDGAVRDDLLSELVNAEGNVNDKIESCAKVIKNLEAERSAVGEEIARLDKKQVSLDKNIERLKKAVVGAMERLGAQKVKTPLFTIYPRENVSVAFEDEKKLPREFCASEVVTKYKPDRVAMRKYIQAGGEILGVWLVKSKSLQIR